MVAITKLLETIQIYWNLTLLSAFDLIKLCTRPYDLNLFMCPLLNTELFSNVRISHGSLGDPDIVLKNPVNC